MKNSSSYSEKKITPTNKPWSFLEIASPGPTDSAGSHYGNTFEITALNNVCCDFNVNGIDYTLNGSGIVFIPPDVVHSFYYKNNCGTVTALSFEPDILKPTFDVYSFLNRSYIDYKNIPVPIPEYDSVIKIINKIDQSKGIGCLISGIIDIFDILSGYIGQEIHTEDSLFYDDEIRPIITWTQQNYSKKISLDEISAFFGYSKYYFCKKFKKITGRTYFDFLTGLRLMHANHFLTEGYSIKSVCTMSGFDDVSYFTQVFKKYHGMTPKEKIKEQKTLKESRD